MHKYICYIQFIGFRLWIGGVLGLVLMIGLGLVMTKTYWITLLLSSFTLRYVNNGVKIAIWWRF